MVSGIISFPEVQRRIDIILDKYGNVKDTASDGLYEIRRSLKDKEGAISKRIGAILKKAQQEGIVDEDAGVAVRDGKMLIPVNSANKRKIQGFVYDESSSGKTTFIQPAEIIELENEISELHFAESREIARILYEFSDFLRPYVPELLDGAKCICELDFIIAKAQTALEYIAGMPIVSEEGEMQLRRARHPILEKTLRRQRNSPVDMYIDPGEAYPADLGAERRRKVGLSEDSRAAPVHVPVGNADSDVRDLGDDGLRPDHGRYRRWSVDRQ